MKAAGIEVPELAVGNNLLDKNETWNPHNWTLTVLENLSFDVLDEQEFTKYKLDPESSLFWVGGE